MAATYEGETRAVESPPAAQGVDFVIQQSSNCSPQPSDQAVDREIIDEDGDVLVQSGSKELLVSSKILALASPVFKAMFNSKFLEGSTIRNTQCPLQLPLPEDDPDALAVLFHILHFSSKRKFLTLEVDLQLELVKLSDKYDCTTSISGESGRWLRFLSENNQEPSSLWKSSTVAFLMGHAVEFANFTARLALILTAAELDDAIPTSTLPDSLKGLSCPLEAFHGV